MTIYQFKPTYLYVKQHSVTGKLYFGKTTKNPEKYPGSGKHWKTHIEKHGKEYIETLWYHLFLVQEECTKFALNFSEQHNIVESTDWLNLKAENGLDGTPAGVTVSSETKAKMSLAKKGHIVSDETKAKISRGQVGKKESDETRTKISLAKRGKSRKPFSNETKAKMSLAQKSRIVSDETKAKMSISHIGKKASDETKAKMSAARVQYWKSPLY